MARIAPTGSPRLEKLPSIRNMHEQNFEASGDSYTQGKRSIGTPVLPRQSVAPRVSKLEGEVIRLESKGAQLLHSPGDELNGIVMLEKALWARTRFQTLQHQPAGAGGDASDSVWERGESFVVTCNQLAVRAMQTLQEGYVGVANQLMAAAERVLCNTNMDPFVGFHPLRQRLLAVTLSNHAVLQRLNGEAVNNICATLEKALAVEHPRPSTLLLYNMAAAYVQAQRFDDAVEMAARCVSLANHYLTIPLMGDEELKVQFLREAASHAVLTHHLISTVAGWAGGMKNVEIHHAQLALACALENLGTAHALTTRSLERLEAVQNGDIPEITPLPTEALRRASMGAQALNNTLVQSLEQPPLLPLEMTPLAAKVPPSQVLPFTLAFAIPMNIVGTPPHTVSMNIPTIGAAAGTGSSLPAINGDGAPSSPSTAPLRKPTKGGKSGAQKSLRGRLGVKGGKSVVSLDGDDMSRPSTVDAPASARAHPSTPNQQRKKPGTATVGGSQSARRPGKNTQVAPPAAPKVRGGFVRGRTSAPASEDGSLTADPSLEGTRGSVQQSTPPTTLVPRPPPTQTLSVVPKKDFELYQQLCDEAQQFVEESQTNMAPSKRATRSGAVGKPNYFREAMDLTAQTPASTLKAADEMLRGISMVRPDHTDAEERLWNATAAKLQWWVRGCLARKRFTQQQRRRDQYVARLSASESIKHFWKSFLEIKAARRSLARQRHIRELNGHATLIQSFLRTSAGVEEYGSRVLGELEAEKAKWDHWRQREMSVVLIQSFYRGCSTRAELSRHDAAGTKVQRWWRYFLAFRCCKAHILRRRVFIRNRMALRNKTATRLQKWALRHLLAMRARRAVAAKGAALEAYLAACLVRDSRYYENLKGVDERECLELQQKVGRSFMARRELASLRQWRNRREDAARRLQRWLHFLTAGARKFKKWEQLRDQRAVQRRIQEVREAVIDIQALARRFLQRCRFLAILRGIEEQHTAARTIQRLARRVLNRNVYFSFRDDHKRRQDRYETAALRTYSAIKIQAVYRGRRGRIDCARFKRFMKVDRHALAQKIQRQARQFIARKRRQHLQALRMETKNGLVMGELRNAAAGRIQAVARMFIEKMHQRRSVTEPIAMRRRAARSIQRVWRRYAAKCHVQQLLMARKVLNQHRINEEHRQVYAVMIQTKARQSLINPNRIKEAESRTQDKAAALIQRTARRYLGRLHVARLFIIREENEERAFSEEELHFAAMRIQKTLRGHRERQQHLQKVTAVTKIAALARGTAARRQVADLNKQRTAREEAISQAEDEEAAAAIQRAWRRHSQK